MRAEHERDPWEDATRTGLEVLVGSAYAAFLLAHGQLGPPPGASAIAYWSPALAICLAPFAGRTLARALRLAPAAARGVHRWSLLAGLVALVFFDARPGLHLLALLTWGVGALLTRSRSPRAAAWLLALVPAQVLCALAAAPGDGWLLHVPLVVALACAAALLLSGRTTRADLRARGPRRLWRALSAAEPARRERRERLRTAPALAAVTLLGAAALYPLLAAVPRPHLAPDSSRARAERERDAETRAANRDAREASRLFLEELSPGGALSSAAQEVVMFVRARRPALGPSDRTQRAAFGPPEHVGPLRLRGACLDTFTATGLRASGSEPGLVRDEYDPRHDGWCLLDPRRPRQPVRLEVEQQSFRTPGGRWEVLFAHQPALAVRAQEVYYDPDGLLALGPGEHPASLSYSVVCDLARPGADELAGRRAQHRDARFVQLPRGAAELAREAGDIVRGATDDLERVQRVVAHFTRGFTYSRETRDVPGLDGITSFLRRRRGHCTSFAAAAVLYLRLQGIASRVVTGFLAQGELDDEGRYVVTDQNGHAWIEVWFEGMGWQTFDPTPAGARAEAEALAAAGLDRGLGDWWRRARADVLAWTRSGADEGELDLLVDTLRDLPRALGVELRLRPAWLAPPALLGLALLLRRRRARRRVERALVAAERGAPEPSAAAHALLAGLAALGLERRRGETLLELARRAADRDPAGRWVAEVRALYARGFGAAR